MNKIMEVETNILKFIDMVHKVAKSQNSNEKFANVYNLSLFCAKNKSIVNDNYVICEKLYESNKEVGINFLHEFEKKYDFLETKTIPDYERLTLKKFNEALEEFKKVLDEVKEEKLKTITIQDLQNEQEELNRKIEDLRK